MLWFLNRFAGTFLGFGFGLVRAPYMVGIGVYHALGSMGLFFYNFLFRIQDSARNFWRDSKINGSWLVDAMGSAFNWLRRNIPNPFMMLAYLVIGVLVSPLVFVAKEFVYFIRELNDLLNTIATFAYNVLKSLATMFLVALSLPIVGMVVGMMSGIGEAYRQIFVGKKVLEEVYFDNDNHRQRPRPEEQQPLVNPDAEEDFEADIEAIDAAVWQRDAVAQQRDAAERARISAADAARRPRIPVDRSVNGFIHRIVINNLPINKAAEGTDKNRELAVAIDVLPANEDHLQAKAAIENLPDVNPLKLKYLELNTKYQCSMSLNDLFEMDQPLTVEFLTGGGWHTLCYESSYLINMLNGMVTDFSSLPDNRIQITGRYRVWDEEKSEDNKRFLHSWDYKANGSRLAVIENSELKIYKGIPGVVRQELANATEETKKLNDGADVQNNTKPKSLGLAPGGA